MGYRIEWYLGSQLTKKFTKSNTLEGAREKALGLAEFNDIYGVKIFEENLIEIIKPITLLTP